MISIHSEHPPTRRSSPGDARGRAAAAVRRLAGEGAPVVAYGDERAVLVAVGIDDELVIDDAAGVDWPRQVNAFLGRVGPRHVFGYLGFDLHRASVPALRRAPYPAAWLVAPRSVVRVDLDGVSVLHGDTAGLRDAFLAPAGSPPRFAVEGLELDAVARAELRASMQRALGWIDDTPRRLTVARKVPVRGADLAALFAAGSRLPETTRAFYLRSAWLTAAGRSPELLAAGSRRAFTMHKLSGTMPLAGIPGSGGALVSAMATPKIRGEHASSIDSAVAALSAIGTVQWLDTAALPLPRMVHLMTTLRVVPHAGASIADCLRVALPAGARPEREGLLQLAELERAGRGAYYGLIGAIAPDGSFSFSQVLRSLFTTGDESFGWAGAALTSASTPDAEVEEVCLKLRGVTDPVDPAREAPGPGSLTDPAGCSGS